MEGLLVQMNKEIILVVCMCLCPCGRTVRSHLGMFLDSTDAPDVFKLWKIEQVFFFFFFFFFFQTFIYLQLFF